MYKNIYDLEKEKCTGCGACYNACKFNAISMQCNEEGFIEPKIDETKCTSCGICSRKCPALNISYSNSSKPSLYAVRASDEIRALSSSGGMFTVMAEEIINRGGYVCGAAYDENLSLKHIMVDKTEDLSGLRGSKYVQSDTGDIYNQVKEKLKEGKPVLFCGTPCQVAAMKAVAGDDKKLFTADLLCHGVPSQSLFKRYIDEKFPEKNVVDVQFRNKKFGWTAEHIRVVFDDDTAYESETKFDPYLKAFMRNISLRKSCGDCPFSEFPRQGDITIGDFWGITPLDKTQSDKKGTSLIYVNSKKGIELFKSVSDKITAKEYDFKNTVIKNRISSKFPINQNRERFFKFLANPSFTFEQSLIRALSGKYDIGVVSNFYAGNFGGSLTQYALYNTLEKMGYSCLMIERPAEARDRANFETMKKIYIEPPFRETAMFRQRETKYEMYELNNNCDAFVVGSDQLFQYALYNDMGQIAALDWVRNDKKKIAYAASYGHDYIWGDKKVLSDMSFFMRKFDAFSVREESGVKISKEHFGVDAEWVLDPVFLCDVKYYDKLIEKSARKLPKHYIASYILDPSEDKAKILKTVEKKLGIRAQVFSEFGNVEQYAHSLIDAGIDVQQMKVEERLQLIKNCDFFVSDSFHGTCFAIIFGKPFVAVINKKRGGSRFESLLHMFGLEERLIYSSEDLAGNEIIYSNIDYSKVNGILDKQRERCLSWLENALKEEKKVDSYSDYDVLISLIREQREEIKELQKRIRILSDKIDLGLNNITDIHEYIEKLKSDIDKYTIFMSVKDTPGMSVTKQTADALKSLGVKNDLVGKHWNSFGCIIDGGNNVFEQLGSERIRKRVVLGDNEGWLVSSNFKLDNVSKIIINKKEYSTNRRGLNIVVWNKENNILEDSVCFDMHLKKYECIRK